MKKRFSESALYKVKSNSLFEQRQIQNVIKKSHANIVTVNPDFFVIENRIEKKPNNYTKNYPYGLLRFALVDLCDKITDANFPYIKEFSK